MNDREFLSAVACQLPSVLGDEPRVIEVRVDRNRSWLAAEVRFELAEAFVCGSAFLPLDEEWRYLSGFDAVDDYAVVLAGQIESAARSIVGQSARPGPAKGPEEVALRWQWLLERLALNGRVSDRGDGSLEVLRDDGSRFAVHVSAQQWARIAEPIDLRSDDPQDFNQLCDEEAFLVYFEDSMVWSTRAALPPVPFGGEIRRRLREARERGEDMSQYGWFAYGAPGDQPQSFSDELE